MVNLLGIPSLLSIIIIGDSNFPLFSIFIFITMLLSMYEWNILSNIQYKSNQLINFTVIIAIFIGLYLQLDLTYLFLIILIHTFCLIIIEIVNSSNKPLVNIGASLLGTILIGIFIGAIILIRNFDNGLSYTLMMFLSIWLCDTFAFVFGSAYGVKKLIPLVSPNKTWFGTICGFLSSFIVPMIFYIYYPIAHLNFSDYIIFSFIFGILGQLGDLSISLLKREAGVKDTSNILQGHGGVLDRFDSLSFVAPFLYIFLYFKYLL